MTKINKLTQTLKVGYCNISSYRTMHVPFIRW